MKKNGSTLIELIIYTSILSMVLLVIYQLFILLGSMRINNVAINETYQNANRTLYDFEKTIETASSIDLPVPGESGNTLKLNGGAITYSLNNDKQIEKKEGTEINKLTNKQIRVENLSFSVVGPSVKNPTVMISFTVKGSTENQETSENFQTSVTKR